MNSTISSSDISVIVQGAVNEEITSLCIDSIRKFLPNAEVILSTWENCNIKGLSPDKLVMSKDPGFHLYSNDPNNKILNNINRQLVSSLAGLNLSEKKYAFKIRTDFILTGNSFLKFFKTFDAFEPTYKIFKEKLLACSYFSRNPRLSKSYPFHPSDIAFFGLTEDLINIFDIPLMPDSEELYWGSNNIFYTRYVPEQYIFLNFLRKNGKEILCDYQHHEHMITAEETERYFISNFIFLDWSQFCLGIPKKFECFKKNKYESCITHYEWQVLYKKYIDSRLVLPVMDNERLKISIQINQLRRYKKIANLITCLIPKISFLGKYKKNLKNKIISKLANSKN